MPRQLYIEALQSFMDGITPDNFKGKLLDLESKLTLKDGSQAYLWNFDGLGVWATPDPLVSLISTAINYEDIQGVELILP